MNKLQVSKGKRLYNISLILYILLTIFLTTMFIYIIFFSNSGNKDNYNAEVLVFLLVYLIIIGIPGYSIITILDLIALIMIKTKDKEDKKTLKKSIILLILPILTVLIYYVLCTILIT